MSQGRAWGRQGPRGSLQGEQQEARGASWHLIRAPEPQAGSWAVLLRDGWPSLRMGGGGLATTNTPADGGGWARLEENPLANFNHVSETLGVLR